MKFILGETSPFQKNMFVGYSYCSFQDRCKHITISGLEIDVILRTRGMSGQYLMFLNM